MKKVILVLSVIVLCSFSMASNHVRGGTRGGELSLGFDMTSTQNQAGSLGYGAAIIPSSGNPLGLFLSFNSVSDPLSNPNYMSMGPIIYVGNTGGIGAFLHFGWSRLLNSPNLNLEAGVELLNNHSAALNIELLYAF